VHGMASNDCQIGHPHHLRSPLFNERHSLEALLIARPASCNLAEKAAVDLIQNLKMPRQHPFEHLERPSFQSLGHECVIGVSASRLRDLPRFLPTYFMLIDERTHQFSHSESRMSIVHLNRYLIGELAGMRIARHEAAE